jgi:hypothetical protein
VKLILINDDDCDVDEFELTADGGYDLNNKKTHSKLISDIVCAVHIFTDDDAKKPGKKTAKSKKDAKNLEN